MPAKEKAAFLASGEKYAKAGKYQEAVIQFRNAIEIDPRSCRGPLSTRPRIHPAEGHSTGLPGAVDDGRARQPETLTRNSSSRPCSSAPGKYDDAQAAAEKVIAADPRNARAHTLLGTKHAALHAWPLAIREFQTAIEIDPTEVENYAGLALAYVSTSRTPEAEATLQKATKVQTKSVIALLNLGRFYFMQHRLAEAEAAMRAASEADPQRDTSLDPAGKDLHGGREAG